ncbi:hypothetical protein OROGR_001878 [Orobanche gracilis]
MASTSLQLSITLRCTSSNTEPFLVNNPKSNLTNYFVSRQRPSRISGLTFSSCRPDSANSPVTSKKIHKKKNSQKNVVVDKDVDEDAFEALFHQLEKDLQNEELNVNDGRDDDTSEENLAELEQELAEALADDELLDALNLAVREETENEDDEEEETPIKLKNWQLKRLAYALKNGRRKTSIKNLAADLCLDRAVVLKLLRDPPPNLVMLSDTLPDKPTSTNLNLVEKPVETFPSETITPTAKREEVKEKVPVHVMQSSWSARKRLKKVQVETLEQVYRRTKRPTNAMISSIVHVTSLPRKKVVKWFEDKRAEEGVPEHRLPYQRFASESVITS